MNSKARQLAERIAKINVRESCLKALNDPAVGDKMVELNLTRMFDLHVGALGDSFGNYSPNTAKFSPNKTSDTEITLHDTGEFYSSVKVVDAGGDGVKITGDSVKESGDLADDARFENALGLADFDRSGVVPLILELIQADIKAQISA